MLLFSIYVFQIKRKKILNNNYHSCVGSLISPPAIFFFFTKNNWLSCCYSSAQLLASYFKNTILFKRYNVFCIKIPTIDSFTRFFIRKPSERFSSKSFLF